MLRFRILTLLGVCFLISAVGARAQEESDEAPLVPSAVVARDVRLRRTPDTTRPPLGLLHTGARLLQIDPQEQNGFIYVLTPQAEKGWVALANVRRELVASTFAARSPCKRTATDLSDCPDIGCELDATTTQAVVNATKHRRPGSSARATTLTFADFRSLQRDVERLMPPGQHLDLTRPQRNRLRGFTVSGGTVREGSLVRISGFIPEESKPHANPGESVNCKFTPQAESDFHITLAPRAGDSEFKGIVVEMIPQGRPAGWTTAKLRDISSRDLRVLVVGALFFDNIHLVNDDETHSLGGQPKRFSLWEVHPITQFFVCQRARNACAPDRLDDWTPLADF
ncbi:MAG TPA: hypothetical protein VF525_19805 [Pyrinomonadaceae bacterium]